MFKWLFVYWNNNIDSTSINFKLNLWSYINAKYFKVKVSNYIVYFILNLNNLYLKSIKIFYKNLSFELLYFKLLYICVFFILLSLFL